MDSGKVILSELSSKQWFHFLGRPTCTESSADLAGCPYRRKPERGLQAVCPGAASDRPGDLSANGRPCHREDRPSSAGSGLPSARCRCARARVSVS